MGIGLQADQIARMVFGGAVCAVGLALRVEMTTGTHAIAAGAIAFFMYVEAMHRVGCQAGDFRFDQHVAVDF